MIDLIQKKEHLQTAIKDKEIEAYFKSLAEKFWIRRANKLDGKNADDAKMTAGAANHEKHVAEEWVAFLTAELAAIEKEIDELRV